MRMKYFRFLYGETGKCFLHFGELQDTTKEEAYTFLYLGKMEKHVNQTTSGHRLFLFPEHLNLVVLGNADAESFQALEELLSGVTVDTLILGENAQFTLQDKPERVGEMIRLGEDAYQIRREGWYFLVKSFSDGTIAMAHGLPAEIREELPEDCVMCVKDLREESLCRKKLSPDKYGCALGCALHQDYDVCKYRGDDREPEFLAGTLLLGSSEDEATYRGLLDEVRENIGEIRFICFADGRIPGQVKELVDGRSGSERSHVPADRRALGQNTASAENRNQKPGRPEPCVGGFRRYLIGTEELDDHAIAELSRGGWNRRPVVLRDGEGICCSGFLKYPS